MLFELSDERYRPVRVDARDKMGGTPLHHALHYGLKKEVELLLRRGGADPNSATDNGLSPLHIVCLRDGDDEDLARMFFQINDELHRRVEVDARDRLDSTPLHTAIYYGNKNLVEFLLRRGADANFADKNGSTPLHFVCGREVEDVDLAKRFFEVCDRLNQPVPIESRDNSNNTPLHLALIRGHKKIVELLLRRGAGPNLANEEGETPLHTICQGDNDDDDLATMFFEINDELHVSVLIDAKDKEGRTPLQFAVANLLPRVVDVLLDRGADLSSFVFPASSYFGKDLENDRLDSKPRLTFEAVAVVERLERRGYEPVRDDALTIMQFFAEHGLFADKSSEFEAELPSRGFFRRWALDCFLELTNDRLPILCFSLADLQSDNDAERSFRKFKLIAEDVQGRNLLTNFHGMDLTTDKLKSMVKKWQTLIEAVVDVKTTDGYSLRIFCIGFTNKDPQSSRKTCYAQHSQVRSIRRKMVDIITEDVTKSDLKGVVSKLLPDAIAKDIEKACQGIYPLHDVYIRKVKVLKKPRFELSKLLELHGDGGSSKGGETGEAGTKVDRPEGYEPPVQESV
ncbi:unnamed protein product [Trichogramma brassicae]|uniref:Small ribosomal subunit protein eS1 n=1 Tax=Trichogramma brassicae TaxID=86971 RepID=A0A6H5J082_9HYME|nr:unnamed protein product [Trichogramma brassicae]